MEPTFGRAPKAFQRLRQGACRVAAVLSTALVMQGCSPEPPDLPVLLIRLEISDAGAYAIDGTAVEKSRLVDVLRSKQQPGQKLGVELRFSEHAPEQAVIAAMVACREVGAPAGWVANEQFLPRAASGSGP